MRLRENNGTYLNKFELKEDAEAYMMKLVDRYKYTPFKNKLSITKLIKEAKSEGVHVHRGTFTKLLKDLEIPIRQSLRNKKKNKRKATFSLSFDVLDELDSFEHKSYIAELGLKLVMGLPTEDLVVFFPDKGNKERLQVIFRRDIIVKAIVIGSPDKKDVSDIRTLLSLANSQGMDKIKTHFDTFNYRYYGGHNW